MCFKDGHTCHGLKDWDLENVNHPRAPGHTVALCAHCMLHNAKSRRQVMPPFLD